MAEELPLIRGHVEVVRSIAATLDPTQGNCEFRRDRQAGVRIVLEGPSMIHALDLHQRHPEPLTSTDLLPFRDATPHNSQLQSLQRRSLMRRARSTKKRPRLLDELESRYKDSD